jgi:hypothetical protein
MTSEEHILALGKLLGNLHALETALRIFLSSRPDARPIHDTPDLDVLELPVGSELPESDLTAHIYLSDLVKRFNALAVDKDAVTIDLRVVDLRNALVHGCVFGRKTEFPVHLVKFRKVAAGKVILEMNSPMTTDWFDQQIDTVVAALKIVMARLGTRTEV